MTTTDNHFYDLVVVGGGQAGCAVALTAAATGRTVAVVESRPGGPGGASVHETDLPAAVCRETAALLRAIRHAGECAVVVPDQPEPDFAGLARRRMARVAAAAADMGRRLEAACVKVFNGRGYLAAADTVMVLDCETGDDIASLRGRTVVIATGSSPAPPVWFQPDGRHLLTLPQVYALRRWLKSALIIGGGPDACEVASFLALSGTSVNIGFPQAVLLPQAGDDMSRHLATAFQREGLSLAASATATGCEAVDGVCTTTLSLADSEELIRTEAVIWAGPKRAVTDNLGLRKLGIATDDASGAIETDACGRTAAPTVYAVGACADPECTALEARLRGEWLAANLAGERAPFPTPRNLIRALATEPPVAWVGLTPAEAQAACPGAVTACIPLPDNLNQPASASGLAAIVGDAATGEILGAQAIGAQAAAFVSALSIARQFEYGVADLAGLIPADPAISIPLASTARAWVTAASGHR
ncbi:MAG: FAD-dependent oxidoreductase [Candidatus Sumerlaeaceae bacterium]|nr:FAD-dependent oxidoreductase [Candidatus Sumerlaeaceae bacterium]